MTWGLSGSGKSRLAAGLGGALPAVVLRSDVERKRLLGKGGRDPSLDRGIYSSTASDLTYGRLLDLGYRPDRIVLGIDGSPASAAAVEWTADVAKATGAEVLAVPG